MKATSPAANKSPMAIVIKSANEILLMPSLFITRYIAKYIGGIPHINTANHAGSTFREKSFQVIAKLFNHVFS